MTPNRFVATAVACLILALAPTACCTTSPQSQTVVSADGVEIQNILTEVQKALEVSAEKLKGTPMPPLDSVTLTLAASAAQQTGGKISLFFIAFGRSVQREATQELVLTLTPPKAERMALAPPKKTLAEQLVDAIVGAVKGVQAARADKETPLELQTLEVSLAFVVEKDTSPGGSFTIQPVTLSFGADFKDKAVQKLRLVFKAKK